MKDEFHVINRPPWMDALIDQRIAAFKEGIGGDDGLTRLHVSNTVVVTPLVEPPADTEESRKVWDETCDGCGKYVPGKLYDGEVTERVGPILVHMFYGVCGDCREALIA